MSYGGFIKLTRSEFELKFRNTKTYLESETGQNVWVGFLLHRIVFLKLVVSTYCFTAVKIPACLACPGFHRVVATFHY